MSDKKISDLTEAGAINQTDVSILVSSGSDYKFAFSTLLQFLGNNLNVGANISFGTTLPQNISGKNGDLFINTTSGSFAQKVSGIWSVVYTLPSNNTQTDTTVLYGSGIPASSAGNNGDTYINTGTGVFYKKSAGNWGQVFSMQTGPQGPQGTAGINGSNGTNGLSVLNGFGNPSNLNTGVNGDFYINTSNYTLFGPKTGGNWGEGVSLIPPGLKAGGAAGQALIKASDNDYDTEWNTLNISFEAIEGQPSDNAPLSSILNNKVDKVTGYSLSQENYTTAEKSKLANLSEHFKGKFTTLSALTTANPTGNLGDYAFVDTGTGYDSKMYIWDGDDNTWVMSSGETTPDATETSSGLIELATIAEALARTDDQRAMTALKTISLILDEKKKVSYQINPVSLNEVSILMENSGQVNSILISGANNAKLKIGTSGTYPTGAQTYPFPYSAGDRVFITYNYNDLTQASCNVKLKCQDN
ncbi:hypothetical protein ACFS5N_00135 [Mucilaginibacter ximonensis]|uniref:Collagen triple helix repeat protein n=1 Tax=Mucilaginibacter ximonensis TaxID=538021 RepID=A0ABW5Y6J3_9SPHI